MAMQPVVIGDVIWEPSPDVIAKSRLKRFMDQHGFSTFPELLKRADADIEWVWDAAIKDIDIAFYRHYDHVVDLTHGKPWAQWWIGGRMNIVQSCLDRHRDQAFHDKVALIWEGEPGEVRRLTYGELDREVCRLAGALRRLGVRPGDRVGIFMPMCPEVAISVLATAKVGAVIIPLFSGYGPEAIASRLQDGEAKVLICADGFYRRGQVIPMKETADRALVKSPTVTKVIMFRRVVRDVPWTHGRDQVWDVLLEDEPDHAPTREMDPEEPLMIIYTSGTTGRPKGTLHVHGGFPVKAAQDMAHGFDVGADDTIFWYTDIGWMMGPWLILGSLALGATMVLYEGTPDFPAPDRLWRMVADHKVTVLGVSPTLVRSLMAHGDEPVQAHDLSSLRVLGGTGETIKVAGKRLGPAEVESILVAHRSVAESAAVGVPDELKGEALVCFVVLRPGQEASIELEGELKDMVAGALGKPLRPKAVEFVADLPKTRNAKILRRVVKAVYLGLEPGDLSSLENPAALEAISGARWS